MGIPPEDFELLRRKTEAIAIEVFGLIVSFVGGPAIFFLGILGGTLDSFSAGLIFGAFAFFGGILVVAYGSYLERKYTHILWTKQAMREYEEEKLGLKKEFRSYRDYGVLDVIRDKGIVSAVSLGFNALVKKGEPSEFQPSSTIPQRYGPREVEILPEQGTYTGLLTRKSELLRSLEDLEKRLIEGKISEETYKELKKKFEERLNQTDSKLKELQTSNICPACGAQLSQSAKFCTKCGRRF